MPIVAQGIYKIFGPDPRKAMTWIEDLEATGAAPTAREHLRERGYTLAVNDATFTIEDGEFFVIMGLSGSGKSTLVRTLNRLHDPTAGTIEIDGIDVGALNSKELRRLRAEKMSMVFQHFALLPHRTVRDNAAFGLTMHELSKPERAERAERALGQVGLEGWGDAYPDELSGGMRQRVGLARALATEADILLMDEAFSALDPLIKREMQDQMIELQSELRRTIVFITHDLNEAMRLGDRIAVMRDGAIVQIGTTEDILTNPADEYVASFVQGVDRSRVLTADGIMRRPVATVGAWEGPTAAIHKMEELQVSGLFVLTRDGRLLGTVNDTGVAKGITRGVHRLEELLDDSDAVAKVAPDALLAELLIPSASNPLPLAVVDDRGELMGVVPRAALLEGLSDESTGEVPPVVTDDDPTGAEATSAVAHHAADAAGNDVQLEGGAA